MQQVLDAGDMQYTYTTKINSVHGSYKLYTTNTYKNHKLSLEILSKSLT